MSDKTNEKMVVVSEIMINNYKSVIESLKKRLRETAIEIEKLFEENINLKINPTNTIDVKAILKLLDEVVEENKKLKKENEILKEITKKYRYYNYSNEDNF